MYAANCKSSHYDAFLHNVGIGRFFEMTFTQSVRFHSRVTSYKNISSP